MALRIHDGIKTLYGKHYIFNLNKNNFCVQKECIFMYRKNLIVLKLLYCPCRTKWDSENLPLCGWSDSSTANLAITYKSVDKLSHLTGHRLSRNVNVLNAHKKVHKILVN